MRVTNEKSEAAMEAMKITSEAMNQIMTAVEAAGEKECMGILACERGSDEVSVAHLLPAEAAVGHANASPMVIKECALNMQAQQMAPKGLWHSHGHLSVFHSGIDHQTLARLLPAMAASNSKPLQTPLCTPSVTDIDQAMLPLADGRLLSFTLLGGPISGLDAHMRNSWDEILTGLNREKREGCAILREDRLLLEGGNISLSLTIPEGASVVIRKEDHSRVRIAHLYSLVVNTRGEMCAEGFLIHELDGRTFIEREQCSVYVSDDLSPPGDTNGQI